MPITWPRPRRRPSPRRPAIRTRSPARGICCGARASRRSGRPSSSRSARPTSRPRRATRTRRPACCRRRRATPPSCSPLPTGSSSPARRMPAGTAATRCSSTATSLRRWRGGAAPRVRGSASASGGSTPRRRLAACPCVRASRLRRQRRARRSPRERGSSPVAPARAPATRSAAPSGSRPATSRPPWPSGPWRSARDATPMRPRPSARRSPPIRIASTRCSRSRTCSGTSPTVPRRRNRSPSWTARPP